VELPVELVSRKGRFHLVPVVFIVGNSNTGKTLLIERLVGVLKESNYRIAVIKHAPHGYEPDVQGKDTWRYCRAGVDEVVVVGPESLTHHSFYRQEPALPDIIKRIENDVDLVIVEGFKKQAGPKIEVLRKGYTTQRLNPGSDLIAVVSDCPSEEKEEKVPSFTPDEVERLADFLVRRFSLK
jgi:molybdopterin-guanine dinucleotide biosynthesis protein B